MNEDLEILSTINAVDAPPFLYTRIEEKIRFKQTEMISPAYSYTISAAVALLIVFNSLFIFNNVKQHPEPKGDITKSMNLVQDNNLYK